MGQVTNHRQCRLYELRNGNQAKGHAPAHTGWALPGSPIKARFIQGNQTRPYYTTASSLAIKLHIGPD
jgi:hypothetical protein